MVATAGLVVAQMFNFINARKLNNDYNVFEGILRSYIFLAIWAFILGAQVCPAAAGPPPPPPPPTQPISPPAQPQTY